MTERNIPNPTAAHPELAAKLRQIVELVTQADKIISGATTQLEDVSRQVTPPHPPPPPPWRERIPDLARELDHLAATVAKARRSVAALVDARAEPTDHGR